MLKVLLFILVFLYFIFQINAQSGNCTFKQPLITIYFGTGNVGDLNTTALSNYQRVTSSCPTDGHYAYASFTSNCFHDDWHTLSEDHTPGDINGNMMLVNASRSRGAFLMTPLKGLKSNTTYELALWLLNLCKPTDKCPFPLLPDILIQLQTPAGRLVAQFSTGELPRLKSPRWQRYEGVFTTPSSQTSLILTLKDNAPGGCGNDFALDDITFRECVKQKPVITALPKPPVATTKKPKVTKPVQKKETSAPVKRQAPISQIASSPIDSLKHTAPVVKQRISVFPAPPEVLRTRVNPLVKQIQTEAGEIKVDLYDNGEIDGDTVSIYHNNVLLVAHARLSQKPISFRITVDAAHPHQELIMVADNMGSIPPNTSLMIVTVGNKRYQVFISSTEQQNAKVVFDLKE